MPIEPGYGGFASLGEAFAGGNNAGTHQAYMQGATQAASLETALANAKIKRDEAMQREQLRARLIASGMKPEQAELLDTITRGGMGTDYSAGVLGMGRQQQNDARGLALEDVLHNVADPTHMNRALAVANDAPLTTATVDQGYMIDPHGSPDQTPNPTATALTQVLANTARAGAANASASASHARADNVRDHTAHPEKYKAAPKAGKHDGKQALEDARAAVKTGRISKDEAKKRLHDAGLTAEADQL